MSDIQGSQHDPNLLREYKVYQVDEHLNGCYINGIFNRWTFEQFKITVKKFNRGRYNIRGFRKGRTEVSNQLEDLKELCRGSDKGNKEEKVTVSKGGNI